MVTRRGLARALLAVMLAGLLATGCATLDGGQRSIFTRSGRPVDAAALLTRLREARFVLLGEVHDNPAQHAARAELLRTLLADGRPSWVVFEQIDREHSAAIAALAPASARDVDAVIDAGRLDRRGWGWPLHRALFAAALAGGARVVGGNVGRAEATLIVSGGAARLPDDLRRWFADDGSDGGRPEARWTAAQAAQLRRDIDEGHCGALPAAMLVPMALAQRARDAGLAAAMLAAPAGTRVLLIAGNGHVRSDTGVPHYLRSTGVAAQAIVTVGSLERTSPSDRSAPAGLDNYDFVAVTDAQRRADPCAGFKAPTG